MTEEYLNWNCTTEAYWNRMTEAYWNSNVPSPKTFYCAGCNMRFSSSDLLTRHYHTNLENAIKANGQPNPVSVPNIIQIHPSTQGIILEQDVSRSSQYHDVLNVNADDLKAMEKAKVHVKEENASYQLGISEQPRCAVCNKTFVKIGYLRQHNKAIHDGDKPFKCSRCGKKFVNADTLNIHVEKHIGDKPYKCHVCPKQFNYNVDLKRHIKNTHLGEAFFVCGTCRRGFARKAHLMMHYRQCTQKY